MTPAPARMDVRAAAACMLALAACATGPPVSSEAPIARIPRFELSVPAARAYFEEFRMTCVGPERPFSDIREWRCTQEDPGSLNTVRIVGDANGVSQLVGITEGAGPEAAVAFLVGVVGAAVVPDTDAGGMMPSLVDDPTRGGRWNLRAAVVALQPHSDARAIILDPANQP